MHIIVLLQEISSSFGPRGFEYGTQNETFYTLINDVINFMIISLLPPAIHYSYNINVVYG